MQDTFKHTAGLNRRGFRGVAGGRAFSCERTGTEGLQVRVTLRCEMAPEAGSRPESCTPADFIAFLSALPGSPAAAKALSTLRDGLVPPGFIELLAEQPGLDLMHLAFFFDCLETSGVRVAIARRYPSLIRVLQCIWPAPSEVPSGTAEHVARDLLKRSVPHATPGAIRGVLGYGAAIPNDTVLKALLALPPERHPRDREERASFEMVVQSSGRMRALLGGHGHLGSARHGWVEFARLLTRDLPGVEQVDPGTALGPDRLVMIARGLERACQDVVDFAKAFSRQVVLPVLSEGRVTDEAGILAFAEIGMTESLWQPPKATRAAARILFGGKSLPAILELSRQWHRRQHAMDARIRGITPLGHGELRPRLNAWPVPFGPVEAPNGIGIVFLGDTEQLIDEGGVIDSQGVAGLRHCVGGYTSECASGRSAVASVRVATEGSFRRLSTVEFKVGQHGLEVVQNRGAGNDPPPGDAREAVAWLVGEVAEGRLQPAADYLRSGWRSGKVQDLRQLCGYDHADTAAVEAAIEVWAPLLVRPLRERSALLAAASSLYLEARDGEPARRAAGSGWWLAVEILRGLCLALLAFPVFVAELVWMWSADGVEHEGSHPAVAVTAVTVEAGFIAATACQGVYHTAALLASQAGLFGWYESRNGFETTRMALTSLRNAIRAWRLNGSLSISVEA